MAGDSGVDLTGTRALVTGGTSGIGLAMAGVWPGPGVMVVLTSRSAGRAAAAASTLPGALGMAADARDEVSVARAAEQAWTRLGGIDLLVNNAGLGMRTVNPRFMTEPQGFWEVPPEGFRALVDVNLTGYFLMARELTPRMLRAGSGRIVNISMNHSTMTRRGFVPYGPSRGGCGGTVPDHGGRPGRHPGPGQHAAAGRCHRDRHGARRSSRRAEAHRSGGDGTADYLAGLTPGTDVHDERIVATGFEAWLACDAQRSA